MDIASFLVITIVVFIIETAATITHKDEPADWDTVVKIEQAEWESKLKE